MQPSSPGSNQYNFILNPQQPNRQRPPLLQTPAQRLIAAAVFVMVILIVIIIVFSLLTSVGRADNQSLVRAQSYQTELIRLSDEGLENASDPNTKIQLQTLLLFMRSDLIETSTFLESIGKSVSETELAQARDEATDANLASALEKNTYDAVLLQTISDVSASYKGALQEALSTATSEQRIALIESIAQNILTYEGPLDSE